MAPARGVKRAAPAPAAGDVAFKKVQETGPLRPPRLPHLLLDSLKQLGVTKANYNMIVEGVQHPLAQDGLTEDCRKMIVAMIAGSLCVPVDERHQHQTFAVDMIGEVLDNVCSKMQVKIDAEDATVEQAVSGMASLEAAAADSEATWNQATAHSDSCTEALGAASKALLTAKNALAEREEEQRKGDAGLVQAREDKDAIEAVIQGAFQKLREGDWEAGEAKQHYDAIQAIVGKLTLDESLVTAMPGTIMKKPSERGPFDAMVVDQLASSLSAKLAQLVETLEAGAPASAARAGAAEAAGAALEAAKTAQQEGAEALKKAQDTQREKLELLEAAKQKVKDCEPNRLKALEVREALQAELQLFKDLNIACFETLKGRESAKRRKMLAAEEEAKAKEAAAAAEQAEAAEQAVAAEQAAAAAAAAKEQEAATAASEVAEAGA